MRDKHGELFSQVLDCRWLKAGLHHDMVDPRKKHAFTYDDNLYLLPGSILPNFSLPRFTYKSSLPSAIHFSLLQFWGFCVKSNNFHLLIFFLYSCNCFVWKYMDIVRRNYCLLTEQANSKLSVEDTKGFKQLSSSQGGCYYIKSPQVEENHLTKLCIQL